MVEIETTVKTIEQKEGLLLIFKKFDFQWESYIDEEENVERLYATGAIDNIRMHISCKPKECKVEAPDYYVVAPCYSKPEPTAVLNCIMVVVERVRESEKATEEMLQIAKRLEEFGFKVRRMDRGAHAYMIIDNGNFEVTFTPDINILKFELRTQSPAKIVIVAMELAELLKQLQL